MDKDQEIERLKGIIERNEKSFERVFQAHLKEKARADKAEEEVKMLRQANKLQGNNNIADIIDQVFKK